MTALNFIATHLAEFDREDFAVYGSEKVGALVGDHVFAAAHRLFDPALLADTRSGPTPKQLMALARQFQIETDAKRKPAGGPT